MIGGGVTLILHLCVGGEGAQLWGGLSYVGQCTAQVKCTASLGLPVPPPHPSLFPLSLPTLPPPGAAPLLQDVCLPPPLAHLPRLSALRLDSAFHSAVAVLSGRVEHACPGSAEAGNASLPSSGGAGAGNASMGPSLGPRPEQGTRQVDSLDEALAIAGFRRGGRSGMVSRVRGRHTAADPGWCPG